MSPSMVRAREDWPARADRWRDAATLALILGGALLIPLFFRSDPIDPFRLPKAMLLRAVAILIVSVTVAARLLGAAIPRFSWRDPWLLLPAGALAAFALLALASTNRGSSMGALGSAAATAVVFFATVAAARRHAWVLIGVPAAAALGNALLFLVEEASLWMPFGVHPGVPHHLQCAALIGNPNEVGGYLGAAALAWLAVIFSRHAGQRWTARYLIVGALLVGGLVASQTLTAIAAFAAGALVLVGISSWRSAV